MNIKLIKLSDLAGSWKINDKEAEEMMRNIKKMCSDSFKHIKNHKLR